MTERMVVVSSLDPVRATRYDVSTALVTPSSSAASRTTMTERRARGRTVSASDSPRRTAVSCRSSSYRASSIAVIIDCAMPDLEDDMGRADRDRHA